MEQVDPLDPLERGRERSYLPNKKVLAPYLKKAIGKSSARHYLRVEKTTGEIRLCGDRESLGTLFFEAPFIFLPDHERWTLIDLGKACAYCGAVLKVDDAGRMRDSPVTKKQSPQETKFGRYMSGLDCDECNVRWCSKKCHDADHKHELLYHRPENRSGTHAFFDVDGKKVDTFKYDTWSALKKLINEHGLEVCYYGVLAIMKMYYDRSREVPFEALRSVEGGFGNELEFLGVSRDILQECHTLLLGCFKKLDETMDMTLERFVHYLCIYRMNRFGSSLYLVAASLDQTAAADQGQSNCRIELYDEEGADKVDSFIVKPIGSNAVELITESFVEDKTQHPIYTCRERASEQFLKAVNVVKLKKGDKLTLKESDYSVPSDDDDGESIAYVGGASQLEPVAIPSGRHRSSAASNGRRASFTASGSSFGEGIIKYNRDQIREMLQQMSVASDIEEDADAEENGNENDIDTDIDTDSDTEGAFAVDVPAGFGQRRKSVRFDDTIVSI